MATLHRLSSLRSLAATPHKGPVEVATIFGLYGFYEVVRGQGNASLTVARGHTDEIVALERHLHVFGERAVQRAAHWVPTLPTILGIAYIALHFLGTALFLIWLHRKHHRWFPVVRNTLVAATGVALAIYILYPVAPPRLAGLGFVDTVTHNAKVNLSSDLLGGLYNPFAAVPSLHFGYALLVGVTVALLAKGHVARALGWSYPVVMLLVIVATGNHFFLDAAGGALAIGIGYAAASRLDSPARRAERWQPDPGSAVATC